MGPSAGDLTEVGPQTLLRSYSHLPHGSACGVLPALGDGPLLGGEPRDP